MIKRVAIDLDNTVADFMAGAIPLMEEKFGLKVQQTTKINRIEEAFGLKPKHGSKWDKFGIDAQDYERLLEIRRTLYIDGHLFKHLPMLEPDSWRLSKHLWRSGYKVYFITARTRHPTIVEDTLCWLHCNNFKFNDVFFVDDKSSLCQDMDIPVIIDDEPGQITFCRSKGIHVIAMAQDWNAELPIPVLAEGCPRLGEYARVSSWKEVPDYMSKWGL